MSRTIDLTQPLSEDDREYLLARGREQHVFQNDAQFSDDLEARARGLYIPGSAIDLAEGVPGTPSADPTVVNGGGPAIPEEDPGLDSDDLVSDDLDSEEDNYETWTKEQLSEELENRELATTGKKDELIARLREDDASE